jgi:hypothetical protein
MGGDRYSFDPNQLQSLAVSGETATLNRHPLGRAFGEMGRQCGDGDGEGD